MSEFPPRLNLEQLRKQAKDLLRERRPGGPATLAAAQFAVARSYGFATWAQMKHSIAGAGRSRAAFYNSLAADLASVVRSADAAALERLRAIFDGSFSAAQLQERFPAAAALADARLAIAGLYGFATWEQFETGMAEPSTFYSLDTPERTMEPRPPVAPGAWDEIAAIMREHGLTRLRAAGHMTDDALERIARLNGLTSLDLGGSRRVTDAGLQHLARAATLEELDLSGCSITDEGLAVLAQLPALRSFTLTHHRGISDRGLASLGACKRLERVNLLGSNSGDGTVAALAGNPRLRHFKSGDQVTDAGLAHLHRFPAFKTWQGRPAEYSLVRFDAEPNYLLLRGRITGEGVASLRGLDGLFALNLDDERLRIDANAVRGLAALPNLGWLGLDAEDGTMPAIAALPHLRMLMCQDTRAGDEGFVALSRSRTIEYIWGRRCPNLGNRGFAALAGMPALRGLSVSCRNVDDRTLALLPSFPTLDELMPIDVPDAGFRHIAGCAHLESLWCMYCRDTGDEATAHIAALCLKSYYAGQTRITDRGLRILSGMRSLRRITLSSCAGVTPAGVAALAALPDLRELTLEAMPAIPRDTAQVFPESVRVTLRR